MIIYESIAAIIKDIPAIGKDKRNTQGQGYNYRGIDDVMNALQPLLAKHKLFVVPEVLEQSREERTSAKGANLIYSVCKVKYTFYAADGSNVYAIVVGEGMDSGDKATNKAMSAAFKYAMFQTFCIPTEEMIDAESETHEVQAKNQQTDCGNNMGGQSKRQTEQNPKKVTEPQIKSLWDIANSSNIVAKYAERHNVNINDGVQLAIIKKWEKESVEQLTQKEYAELCDWMEGKKM